MMGWISSADAVQSLQLSFDDQESAIRFATKNDYDWSVVGSGKKTSQIRSYADNFTFSPTTLKQVRTK